jgi:hypothetical protein
VGEDASEEGEPADEIPAWSAGETVPARVIAEAACRWLRDIAVRNTVGEPWRKFRVRVAGYKGVKVLETGTFVCRNDRYQEEPAVTEAAVRALAIPEPGFDQAASQGAAKGVRALGDYYAQWGRIVLGSMGQLQGINNAMQTRLHHQLQESRGQVDQLVAAILNSRVAEAQMGNERRADERAADARTLLAGQALQQLGEAAKAFLAAKGMNPEMADVIGSIGQSPELIATLADPDVKELMTDPANLKALAGMLKGAATQARAMRNAANNQNDPGANQAAAG